MRNMKFILIFAACGFVLSFMFGLFSHSSFLYILVRALVFGAVFVGLGFLISFIFKKFLLDSNSLDIDSEDSSDFSQKNNNSDKRAGQMIDVVVQDEELTPSESDNHFVVSSKHQMLKKTDIDDGKNANVQQSKQDDKTFVPMKNFEHISSPDAVSKFEKSIPASGVVSVNTDSKNGSEFSDDDLDTLPDMEGMNLSGADSSSVEEDNNSYANSEFVSPAGVYKKSDSSVPEVKDAALIARAISTALSEEN